MTLIRKIPPDLPFQREVSVPSAGISPLWKRGARGDLISKGRFYFKTLYRPKSMEEILGIGDYLKKMEYKISLEMP